MTVIDTQLAVPTPFQEFTGLQYILIDIASNYGLDKETWDFRINWTLEHENNLMKDLDAILTDPSHQSQYLAEADEPAMMFSGMKALKAAREGRQSAYPISLDATASGMQLLSIFSDCATSARQCNVIPTYDDPSLEDKREDSYTNLHAVMKQIIAEESLEITEDDGVTRAAAKQAIMTALYGSKAEPEKLFGTGELLDLFYYVLEEEIPGAWNMNLGLKGLWQPYADHHAWVLPDNFHVIVKEMRQQQYDIDFMGSTAVAAVTVNQGAKNGLSLCPNATHSVDGMVVRELVRRCSMSKVTAYEDILARKTTEASLAMVETLWGHYKRTGFLSTRILEHLCPVSMDQVDKQVIWNMIKTLPEKAFHVLSIHDCFRCLPNYGNDLRRQYNQILHDLAKSDMISDIAQQITGDPTIYVPKQDHIADRILSSNYALS